MRDMLMAGLSYQGFVLDAFDSAEALYPAVQDTTWDIAIIDVGLPGADGFSLAAWLRNNKQTRNMGLVMLTARSGLADRRQGSALADLYFVKPVDLVQLGASLTNLGHRVRAMAVDIPDVFCLDLGTNGAEMSETGSWRLAKTGYCLLAPDNTCLKLSMQEHVFLKVLLANQGRPVSRETLVHALAYDPADFDMHRLTMAVNRLRKKVEAEGLDFPLRTLRGMGYIFNG